MKRFFAIILTVLMMATCFTACGDPASSGNVSTTPNGIVNGNNRNMEDMPDVKDIVPDVEMPDMTTEDGTGMVGNR